MGRYRGHVGLVIIIGAAPSNGVEQLEVAVAEEPDDDQEEDDEHPEHEFNLPVAGREASPRVPGLVSPPITSTVLS